MADTTKTYENIFIKKNAAGDREYIKVPYAILADPPTIPDVSGFMPKSGGTFTGEVTFNKKINLGQGDANCLYLGSDGRLNGPENRTLFGLVSGSTTFGHQAYSLRFRGSATRPQYTTDGSNYKDLALKSDIPSVPTNYVTTDGQQEISALKTFTSAQGVGSCQGAFRVFVSKEEMDNYYAKFATGDATSTDITFTSMTNKAFLARTNNTNRTAYKDAGIDVWKPSGKHSFLFPEKSGILAVTSDIPDVSGKLDKTAYEENKTINFGNTGVLKIGKFKVYDTNVTCEITSTTSLTYSGKLVIATQNNVIKKMTVYGDAANTVAPNIFVKPSTTSDPYIEVYFKPPSWSKNVIHIYGSAIMEAPTDVCTNVAELPSVATEKPINALTYLAAGDGGYSLNASGYVKGSWLQSSAMSNKGSNTGKVCVFDDNGWVYYRTPAEILSEAGGAKASDVPTITLNGTATTSPSFWASESGGNIAIGDMATTTGADGVAVGYNSSVTSSSGVAIGGVSKVTGAAGIAIGGNSSVVTARSSIAIGYGSSIELASYSIAIGPNAEANCAESISIGYKEDGPSSTASTHIGTGGYSSSGRALYLGTGRTGFTYMNAAGSSWTSASDIRDKTDIQNIDHALDFIKKLKPITYVMNEREKYLVRDENGNPILDENGKQQYDVEAHKRGAKKKHRRFAGLSAQDTYQAMLDCYNNNANYAQIVDNNKFDHPDDEYIEQYCMSYERLVPFLIKAMQEQQEQIEKLRSKLGE